MRHDSEPGVSLDLFANPPGRLVEYKDVEVEIPDGPTVVVDVLRIERDPDLLNVFVDAEAWRAAHPCSCHALCVCDVAVEA